MERERRIRERAHTIWERDGRPDGREREHWERAEAEIDREEMVGGDMPSSTAQASARVPAQPVAAHRQEPVAGSGAGAGERAGTSPGAGVGSGRAAGAGHGAGAGQSTGTRESTGTDQNTGAGQSTGAERAAGIGQNAGPRTSQSPGAGAAQGAGPDVGRGAGPASSQRPGTTKPVESPAAGEGGIATGGGSGMAGKPTGAPGKARR